MKLEREILEILLVKMRRSSWSLALGGRAFWVLLGEPDRPKWMRWKSTEGLEAPRSLTRSLSFPHSGHVVGADWLGELFPHKFANLPGMRLVAGGGVWGDRWR